MNFAKHSLLLTGCLILVALFSLNGCGQERTPVVESPATVEKPKPFDPMALTLSDPKLIEGRELWVPRCGQCHTSGLGGAPKIGDKAAWASRIAQGKEVLYEHAINGFSGPQMLIMPAKGGFTELTDEQVKLCVDFVVHASQ
ncbi:c-type cytochrome [Cerasicoccus maritimus]|uniref:c-type cytochrome n=1 Tax=Cerasicoccus maritimus TaxID=490089 RepID=UPI002852AF1B|nr:c-type cytochrome [Cerasicoccus maritimus]